MYDVNVRIIDQLISLQKSSLKLYIYYTIGIIILGLILVISGQTLFKEGDIAKVIIQTGGTIVTTFSGFSFKELLEKKENINLFETFKLNVEMFKEDAVKQTQFETTLQNYLFKK